MSLKAKIEAVIYASEEPVTLAQLTGLLGLEAQCELDALAARQQHLQLADEDGIAVEAGPAFAELGVESELRIKGEVAEEGVGRSTAAETIEAAALPTPEAAGAEETPAAKRAMRERERNLREFVRELVEELIKDYATSERGLEVREVAGGYRLGTKPEYHDAVRGFVKSLKPPLRLTLQALETLAVVAYKQPVTAPEISEVRGVDSGGVLGSLMARKLITTAGRKQVIGRPILYKTTKDFLLRFGLKDVAELPSIEEFEKMAGELAGQEEMPMADETQDAEQRITHEDLREEQHVTEPQADGDSQPLKGEPKDLSNGDTPSSKGDKPSSSLLPNEDTFGDDPSADEAAIEGNLGAGV